MNCCCTYVSPCSRSRPTDTKPDIAANTGALTKYEGCDEISGLLMMQCASNLFTMRFRGDPMTKFSHPNFHLSVAHDIWSQCQCLTHLDAHHGYRGRSAHPPFIVESHLWGAKSNTSSRTRRELGCNVSHYLPSLVRVFGWVRMSACVEWKAIGNNSRPIDRAMSIGDTRG